MHIVLQIELVEPDAGVLQLRDLPPGNTMHDNVVTDTLDLLRGESKHDRLQNVLVIVLVVEAYQQRTSPHELSDLLIVIMDDNIVTSIEGFEYKQPVMVGDLTVECVKVIQHLPGFAVRDSSSPGTCVV